MLVAATRKGIADLGKSSYIAVSTGFWYEWSLAIPAAFGIDFANRAVTLFDEGETRISTSTLPQVWPRPSVSFPKQAIKSFPQVGRAVAALLSLPIRPEDSNEKACLEALKNKVVYVNSFTVSQKDMLESALRVTGTTEDDWTITKEPARERYSTGVEMIQQGKRIGFAKMMFTRVFYPDGCGDFEHSKGTLNSLLELPNEDIDGATKAAMERSKTSNWAS